MEEIKILLVEDEAKIADTLKLLPPARPCVDSNEILIVS